MTHTAKIAVFIRMLQNYAEVGGVAVRAAQAVPQSTVQRIRDSLAVAGSCCVLTRGST